MPCGPFCAELLHPWIGRTAMDRRCYTNRHPGRSTAATVAAHLVEMRDKIEAEGQDEVVVVAVVVWRTLMADATAVSLARVFEEQGEAWK